MPRDRTRGFVTALLALLLTLAGARTVAHAANDGAAADKVKARSPQEEKRRKLLEEMGLKQQDQSAPPAPSSSSPSSGSSSATAAPAPANNTGVAAPQAKAAGPNAGGAEGKPAATRESRAAVLPPTPSFRRVIHPALLQTCKVCHAVGGPAAMTPFILSGEAVRDHVAVLRVVDLHAPAASLLLGKSSGQKPHAGGAPWPAGGAAYGRALAWIQAGARLDAGGAAPSATAATENVGQAALAPLAATAATGTVPRSLTTPRRRGASGAPGSTSSLPSSPSPAAAAGPSDSETPPTAKTNGAGQATEPADGAIKTGAAVAVAVDPSDFATQVHPLLVHTCAACHNPVGMAAATRLVLSGEVDGDYTKIRTLVDPQAPPRSLLLTKSTGELHAGGVVLIRTSAPYVLLLNWIQAGAPRNPVVVGDGRTPRSPTTPTGDARAPTVTTAPPSENAGVAAGPAHPPGGGLALPYGFALNGRFDLAYERRAFSGDPTEDTAVNALRSYHHFLFLSRESTDDPVGLALELTSLQFWEAHYRWQARELPVQIVIAAGKILVPFGAEPLMHQSYGGLAGFDQRILPPIWAQQGVVVRATAHRRELSFTDDLYVVRGYALKQADAIINLQNDFSAEDSVRLGWGNRLGAAWGPASAWYSAYYNPLGFGRRLVMQAGDVMLARVRSVPVLGHFSFGAGLLRADVSGGDDAGTGGPGKDYYDFGSYFQVRYHPNDWLYFQYRQGLHTFNNRRGLIVDDTRLTSDDGSAHNFGLVARHRGLTAGLYYFINLEKVDEVPDDFLRVSLTYDF